MSSRRSDTRWTLYRFSNKTLFRGIVTGSRRFPMWILRGIVRAIGLGLWPFLGRLKQAVDSNMSIIQPKASPRDLRRLTKLCFHSYLRGVAEFWHYSEHFDASVAEPAGEEMEALKKGGHILLSSHVGNWELGGLYLKHCGVPFLVISQPEEDPYVERQRQEAKARFGIPTLLIGDGEGILFKVRERLEGGDNIVLLADRAFAKDFIPVRLFEFQAAFLRTPFLMSRWLRMPVRPMFFIKEPSGRYRGHHGELIRPDAPERMAQVYAGELEKILRRFPWQWYNFFDYAAHCRKILG